MNIEFSGIATYDKVKRIEVRVEDCPGLLWLVRYPRYDAEGYTYYEKEYKIMLPARSWRRQPARVIGSAEGLRAAKQLVTAIVEAAGSVGRIEELRDATETPAWWLDRVKE